MALRSTVLALPAALLMTLAACGDDDAPGGGGGGTDAGRDAGGGGDVDGGGMTADSGMTTDEDGGGGGEDGGVVVGECPVDANARAMIAIIYDRLMLDANWMASQTHTRDSPVALSLPGVEEGYLASATLAFYPCTETFWYDPYCVEGGGGITPGGGGGGSGEFWADRNQCSRLGCGGPDVYLAEVWFSMAPHTARDDAHAFPFDTTLPVPGTATYDPNPIASWTMQQHSPSMWTISMPIDRAFSWTPMGGTLLDLRHSGSVQMMTTDSHVDSLSLSLTFPNVATPEISGAISMDATGAVTGSIRQGDVTLGTWDSGGHLSWLGGCEL